VPYLSRTEGELARALYLTRRRHQGPGCPDVWSRIFYNMATKISAWLETNPRSVSSKAHGVGRTLLTRTRQGDSILVTGPNGSPTPLQPTQVQAIRQLVVTEFPSCFVVFHNHSAFAEVIRWDQGNQEVADTALLLNLY
jgi:hypothetical protein